MKFKKGDTVIVTAGKDKGKKGKVEKVFPQSEKVLVAGVNVSKRHMKRRDEQHPGGIIEIVKPLPTGNVAVMCPSCNKQTRVGYIVSKDDKVRVCKKCNKKI